ncbi:hypothetical protein ACQ4LE_006053 [Meloidogyne hapla]|uniref:Uncharacterized protein n=1 Tax=Meloidogyne hapla TaxID=6305 RepID=A0A1I8BBU5_MELHA
MSIYFLIPFIFTLIIATQQQNDQNMANGQQNNGNLLFVPLSTKNTAEYIKLIQMLRRPTASNTADSEMFNYKIMPNVQDGRPKRQLSAAFSEGSIITPENRIQREFTEKRFSRIGGNIMMG